MVIISKLLLTFLFTLSSAQDPFKCQSYKDRFLVNQESTLSYCVEHAPRTCCTNEDVYPIRQKLSFSKHSSEPKLSSKCFVQTSKAMCSRCDADVGIGLTDGSLCESFCQKWFEACQSDFIDPYIDR